MKRETKLALLRAFGLAAQDAEPEELEKLTNDTAAVLDAEPAVEAQDAEPAEAVQTRDQRLDALDRKVDKLTETMDQLLGELQKETPGEKGPETAIDEAVAELSGGEAEVISEESQAPADKVTSDAAVRILKNARPAIAAMKDPEEKARVTDALLESIRAAVEDTGGRLLEATASAARQAAQDSDPTGRIEAQQSAYDKRNPHKNNKEAM